MALLAPAVRRPDAPRSASRSKTRTGGWNRRASAGLRTVAVTNTYAADLLRADLTITSLEAMDLDLLARLCSE